MKFEDTTPEQARQLWEDALRSEEYEQGTGFLSQRKKDGKEYDCCLGVACKVFVKAGGSLALDYVLSRDGFTYILTFDEPDQLNRVYLPRKVADWLGVIEKDGEYDSGRLTTDNDEGTNFKEIADIIASKPPGLFVE